jgi:hypothetical protein
MSRVERMNKEFSEAIIAAMLMFENEIDRIQYAIVEGLVKKESVDFLHIQQEVYQKHFNTLSDWLKGDLKVELCQQDSQEKKNDF